MALYDCICVHSCADKHTASIGFKDTFNMHFPIIIIQWIYNLSILLPFHQLLKRAVNAYCIFIYIYFLRSQLHAELIFKYSSLRPQRVSLSSIGMSFDPKTAIKRPGVEFPIQGVCRGLAEQNGLLLQIGPIKQVQGGIHVRYVFGCEGNRCLFTGRGGRLMAPSPLCSRACGLIKAAKLFIHTHILLPLLHTHKHTHSHANKHWHACVPAKVCMRTYEHGAETNVHAQTTWGRKYITR